MDRCEVLQHGSTLVLRLSSSLVARIVVDTDGQRQGDGWFRRELQVVAHLAARGAPVIPPHPGMPAEPIICEGFPISFWNFVHITDVCPAADMLGASLCECHRVLRSYSGELERLAILHESVSVLNHCHLKGTFELGAYTLLRHHLDVSLTRLAEVPMQPLHGDAHPGNWLMTREGLLWTDWEDAFIGPVEWDLASLIWNAQWLEGDQAKVGRILAGYREAGGHFETDLLEPCMAARAAVMCCWYPVLYPDPSLDRQTKLQARLDWLAARG